jgi:VanZ family protein
MNGGEAMTAVPAIAAEAPVPYLRLRLGIGFLLVAAVVYLSLTPHPIEVPGEQGDKYGHIVAYSTLMIWFATIYHAVRERIGLAVAFILLGIALEFLQRLTGYRTFDIADMAADAFGVVLGWLTVLVVGRLPPLARRTISRGRRRSRF